MKTLRRTVQFKTDVRLMTRRGKDIEKLKIIITHLLLEQPLDKKYHDHPLYGQYRDVRERHMETDWLLL